MAQIKNYMSEITLTIGIFIWLWFVLTNVNVSLGSVYLFAGVISLFLLLINVLIFDKNVRVTFQKEKGKWVETIFQGVIGWVLIMISSFVIFKFVDPVKANFNSVVKSFGAANPAFSNSQIVNWLTVSFAIGYFETQLFARIMEWLSDRFNIQINRRSMFTTAFVILVLVLSVLFAILHITAKGIQATNSLIVVAIMMAISLFMIAYNNGETRQAVMVHWISNGVAGLSLLLAGGTLF